MRNIRSLHQSMNAVIVKRKNNHSKETTMLGAKQDKDQDPSKVNLFQPKHTSICWTHRRRWSCFGWVNIDDFDLLLEKVRSREILAKSTECDFCEMCGMSTRGGK